MYIYFSCCCPAECPVLTAVICLAAHGDIVGDMKKHSPGTLQFNKLKPLQLLIMKADAVTREPVQEVVYIPCFTVLWHFALPRVIGDYLFSTISVPGRTEREPARCPGVLKWCWAERMPFTSVTPSIPAHQVSHYSPVTPHPAILIHLCVGKDSMWN